MRIPAEIHPYSAGVTGGLAGGVAMAVLAVLYGLLALRQPLVPDQPARRGRHAVAGAAPTRRSWRRSTRCAFGVALVAHVVVSIFVGLVYAAVLPMFPRHPALWGGWIAPLLWTGLLWASLDLINPALNARIDWRWFVASQIAFGLVAGFVIARSERVATMQSWPLAARAGIEAPGLGRRSGEDGQ